MSTHRLGAVRDILVATSFLVLLGSATWAGNALEAPQDRLVAVAPASAPFLFNGAYVGGGIGYAFKAEDRVGVDGPMGNSTVGTIELDGSFGELHVGYRLRQLDSYIVFGAELGVEAGSVSDTVGSGGYIATSDMDYIMSLKGSIGVLVSPETLLYGFVGVSYGNFEYGVTGNGPIGAVYIDDDTSGSGYVAGFGLERALTDRWSLRGEYQYSNIGKSKLSDAAGNTTQATPSFHSLRLGLNLSF